MARPLNEIRKGVLRVNDKVARLLSVDRKSQHAPYVGGIAEAYARGWEGCPCVFVLSTGRAGTKTLTALFDLSPQVVATHEPEPRLLKQSFDAFMEGSNQAGSEKWRAVVLAARDDAVFQANRRGKIYIETNNRLTHLAYALAAVFPASRFVHLHRHPYEVIRSAMRRHYYQGHNWDFARMVPRPSEPIAMMWEALSPLEKSAWYWAVINAEALAFLESLPTSRRMNLPARKLFTADQETLKALFGFIRVDAPPSRDIKGVLGEEINAEVDGKFPLPSEWSEQDRASVRRIVETTAQALGYEL
jgi:hypothetical protein